jgi:hypothetical protein
MATEPLSMDLADEIAQGIAYRQERFADETLHTSCMVVLLNFGDRWTPVRCVAGEWSGTKRDLTSASPVGVPLCPNGHVLIESADGRRQLGLIDDDRLAAATEGGR